MPPTGEPNSKGYLHNPDGSLKRECWYGPEGNAEWDRDYNHSGKMEFPHDHEWKNGKRGTDHPPPNPAYEIRWDIVGAYALGVVFVIGGVAIWAFTGDPSVLQNGMCFF